MYGNLGRGVGNIVQEGTVGRSVSMSDLPVKVTFAY